MQSVDSQSYQNINLTSIHSPLAQLDLPVTLNTLIPPTPFKNESSSHGGSSGSVIYDSVTFEANIQSLEIENFLGVQGCINIPISQMPSKKTFKNTHYVEQKEWDKNHKQLQPHC
jgi:hypothetical protein